MSVKNLNFYERPYEKLERYGAESLSDAEILAILINSGTKTKTALDIARELTTKVIQNVYEETGIISTIFYRRTNENTGNRQG